MHLQLGFGIVLAVSFEEVGIRSRDGGVDGCWVGVGGVSEVLGGICKECFFEGWELVRIFVFEVEKKVLLSGSVDDLLLD